LIYLHKLLPLVASPLGLICLLLLIGLWWRQFKWIVLALLFLLIFSLPLTSSLIWKSLEADNPHKPIEELENHKAVVVLSGMLGGFKVEKEWVTQWNDSDRFFAGLKVLEAGKAESIIFTRGKIPWTDLPPEGERLKVLATQMGIDPSQILLTETVENTADEAQAVFELTKAHGIPSVILVTSSFHLPRAQLLFDQAGVVNEGYPTDFKFLYRPYDWLSFLPNAEAFFWNSSGIREYIGRLYYWLRA
jgi:uncharacterized SAM-binding protein YcdF (DUF218 family)